MEGVVGVRPCKNLIQEPFHLVEPLPYWPVFHQVLVGQTELEPRSCGVGHTPLVPGTKNPKRPDRRTIDDLLVDLLALVHRVRAVGESARPRVALFPDLLPMTAP